MPHKRSRTPEQRNKSKLQPSTASSSPKCIFINPFHGGSHQHFGESVLQHIQQLHQSQSQSTPTLELYTLPGKKWHWRLLVSAAHFARIIPLDTRGRDGVLFTTSLLNLSDLVALRPDLGRRTKIIYFHENQFEYPDSAGNQQCSSSSSSSSSPSQRSSNKWSEYGWSQIMSALVADRVLFNSLHNRTTFLEGVQRLLSQIPKPSRPLQVLEQLQTKSQVLHYPVSMSAFTAVPVPLFLSSSLSSSSSSSSATTTTTTTITTPSPPLHVVWNHRWEFDKGPDELLQVKNIITDSCTFCFLVLVLKSF